MKIEETISEHDCKHKGEKWLQRLPKGGVVAEVGVAQGNFSGHIFRITQPKKLHLIDCWELQSQAVYKDASNLPQPTQDKRYNDVVSKFKAHPEVIVHRGFSAPEGEKFADEYFDWIYLDANHGYKAVKEDLETYYPKIKKGGWITGHDYHKKWGVIQAVDEFVEAHDDVSFKLLATWGQGSYVGFPSYMLRKV